jgi:hypothetical protein
VLTVVVKEGTTLVEGGGSGDEVVILCREGVLALMVAMVVRYHVYVLVGVM